jgi:hypothetical protein
LTSLVKKIDERLDALPGKRTRPPGVYIIFDSNATGLDQRLRELAQKENLRRVMLCIGPPPRDYAVNGAADVTVVIYRVGRRRQEPVTANFALRQGDLTAARADAIVQALSEALPK